MKIMTVIRITILLFLIGNISSVFSQEETATSLLKKVTAFYENDKNYEINTTYKMYKGLVGDTITESYTGYMLKENDKFQFKVGNNELVTVGKYQLAIDHDQKLIVHRKSNQQEANSLVNIEGFLEYYEASSIKKGNGYIECELIAKKNMGALPYAKITLYINSENFSVKKQEMYFSTQLPFVLDNGKIVNDYGRLEVMMKEEEKVVNTIPNFSNYFKDNGNGQKQLINTYSNYQFIDQTKQ